MMHFQANDKANANHLSCVCVLSMLQFDLSSIFILISWRDVQPWRMRHSLGHASIYKRMIILLCTLMAILIIQQTSLSAGVRFFVVESSLQYGKLIFSQPWSSLPT
jgi:hypothetical protein